MTVPATATTTAPDARHDVPAHITHGAPTPRAPLVRAHGGSRHSGSAAAWSAATADLARITSATVGMPVRRNPGRPAHRAGARVPTDRPEPPGRLVPGPAGPRAAGAPVDLDEQAGAGLAAFRTDHAFRRRLGRTHAHRLRPRVVPTQR
ncbi:hypothetical protein [Streptomyces sp. SID3343]|uniref:hypothetical protein n=1 Tax=Streptomyces sp. SID3343 TaxID=2690260 RepID=UPI00136CB3A4|nr:hypothetical protein [Streptomyces sp. SID3343]MYV96852.1 hypothetical protein [Streptomyces sp. SID3343]